MKCGLGLVAAVLGVALLPAGLRAEERTRHFPAANCRYTLPGDGWSWADPPEGGKIVFAATAPSGAMVMLSVLESPPSAHMDQRFADNIDKGLVIPGKLEKRGGRLAIFLGLPCYQVEGRMFDGRTTASRVFLANGRGYHLWVVGGKAPVEQSPEFEAILGGFAFDSPPTPPPPGPSPDKTDQFSGRMGEVGGGILLFAGVIAFLNWITRSGRANRPTRR